MFVHLLYLFLVILGGMLGFSNWLYGGEDKTYRSRIDTVIDKLDAMLPPEPISTVASRFLCKLGPFLSRPFMAHSIVTGASIVVNAFAFVASLVTAIQLHFPTFGAGITAFVDAIRTGGWSNFILMNVLVASTTAAVDNLSFSITHTMVRRVSTARSGAVVAGWLFLDGLAVVACLAMTYAILGITLFLFYDIVAPSVYRFSGGDVQTYMEREIWLTLEVNPVLWWVVIALGTSAALPSVIFLVTATTSALLRSIKKYAPQHVSAVLYRVAVHELPVAAQLAGALLFAANIIVAIASVVTSIVGKISQHAA